MPHEMYTSFKHNAQGNAQFIKLKKMQKQINGNKLTFDDQDRQKNVSTPVF